MGRPTYSSSTQLNSWQVLPCFLPQPWATQWASGSFSWLHSVLWACSLFPLDVKATRCGLLPRQRPYNHLQPWKQSASSNGKTNTEIFVHTQSFMTFHDVKSFKLHTKKLYILILLPQQRRKKRRIILHHSQHMRNSCGVWILQWRTPKNFIFF